MIAITFAIVGLLWNSPAQSNGKNIPTSEEIQVLIATDVLSEGLNLQDCFIIVNYDLPWAIIRLIQRVGRVDKIGQNSARHIIKFISDNNCNGVIFGFSYHWIRCLHSNFYICYIFS